MYHRHQQISTRWHTTTIWQYYHIPSSKRQEVMERDRKCKWTQHWLVCYPLGQGSDMTCCVWYISHTDSCQLIFSIDLRCSVGSEVNLTACVWDSLAFLIRGTAIRMIYVQRSLSAFPSLCVSSHYCAIVHTANKSDTKASGKSEGQNWGMLGDVRTARESFVLSGKLMTAHSSWKPSAKWLRD